MTAAAFCRSTGNRATLSEYAEEENNPRKRRSPMTCSFGVEDAKGDVVEVGRPVYPGLLVVLGDDHQLGIAVGLRDRVEGAG